VKDTEFYRILYLAEPEDFKKHWLDVKHMIGSFQLLSNSDAQTKNEKTLLSQQMNTNNTPSTFTSTSLSSSD
jgi:hypothetical protein